MTAICRTCRREVRQVSDGRWGHVVTAYFQPHYPVPLMTACIDCGGPKGDDHLRTARCRPCGFAHRQAMASERVARDLRENSLRVGDCDLWLGRRDVEGYGIASVFRGTQRAHRQAWVLANGPIPSGMVVMHLCDQPACVRLAHLRVGTQAENIADRDAKGRTAHGPRPSEHVRLGEASPNAKLTDAQVATIKRRLAQGETRNGLAREYGVAKSTIGWIKNGHRWVHVAPETEAEKRIAWGNR